MGSNQKHPTILMAKWQTFWKTFCPFFLKLNIHLLYNPQLLLLGIYLPKGSKSYIYTRACISIVRLLSFENAKKQKQPNHPAGGEWISKL